MRTHSVISSLSAQEELVLSGADEGVVWCRDFKNLTDILAKTDARVLTFVAPWRELTVAVSRLLAMWAAQEPCRGCGLVTPYGWLMSERLFAARVSTLAEGTMCWDSAGEWQLDGAALAGQGAVYQDALKGTHMTPTGLALTAHGAEHCLRLGGHWLIVDERMAPGPNKIIADQINCGVLFLNSCAALRLGDSVVPERYSVAASFHRRGIAVIGPYRNVRTTPQVAKSFSSRLRAGVELGVIVNELNREAKSWGEANYPFQLFGNPRTVFPVRQHRSMAPVKSQALPELRDDLEGLNTIVGQYVSLAVMWSRLSTEQNSETNSAMNRLIAVQRSVVQAYLASRMKLITLLPAEIAALKADAEGSIASFRESVIAEIVSLTASGKWIDNVYASVAIPGGVAEKQCGLCGNEAYMKTYVPFGSTEFTIIREECARCGTLRDQLGEGGPPRSIKVEVGEEDLRVWYSEFRGEGEGRIFVHRAKKILPMRWECNGGEKAIGLSELPFSGRITVIGLWVSACGIVLNYNTTFAV